MRRTAFTLLELLAVIPLLIAAGLIFGVLFTEMVRQVPQLASATHTNGQIQTVLARMQRDFDSASALLASANDEAAGETRLWLAEGTHLVRWQVQAGQVSRDEYATAPEAKHLGQTQWSLARAKLRFEQLPAGDVAVHSAVEYRTSNKTQDKLVNTHLFRPSALPGHREEP